MVWEEKEEGKKKKRKRRSSSRRRRRSEKTLVPGMDPNLSCSSHVDGRDTTRVGPVTLP